MRDCARKGGYADIFAFADKTLQDMMVESASPTAAMRDKKAATGLSSSTFEVDSAHAAEQGRMRNSKSITKAMSGKKKGKK